MDKTTEAVVRQIRAMGSDVFEVGLFKPNAGPDEPVMLPRTWDVDALLRSIPWLRHQNRDGRNIYIRPSGEHNLTLVDDLTQQSVVEMKRVGFDPAVVFETSPANYQAWVKHPDVLSKEEGTVATRALATQFGGDFGAADWRHFGRLSGFTNRKEQYRDGATGLFPFVRLIEANGQGYPKETRFIAEVKATVEQERQIRERQSQQMAATMTGGAELKSIDEFRNNAKYGGDATRVDLAYAIYALSHGASEAQVKEVIGSRDLSHKGNDRRQQEYVDRTVKKACDLMHSRGR